MSTNVVHDIEVFYRDRISKIDEERLKITKYISIIKPNQRERHTLEWDSKQLTEAAMKVDYDLCNINDDHRRVTMQNQEIRSELLNIAKRHTANQSQIQQLAEISQPVERDITYFFDRKYSLITPEFSDGRKSSNTTIQKPKIVRAGKGEVSTRSQNTQSVPKQPKTGEVLRLESKLKDETRRFQQTLEEFQSALTDIESSILRAKEAGDRVLEIPRLEAANMISENNKYDYQCYNSVAELLKLRLRILIAQREEMEELDRLDSEKKAYVKMESRIQKELEVEIKLMGENLKIDMAAVEEDFAAQLHDVTEKCNVLRKKEKVALSKTNLKSANVIEKLSTDLAYAQNRYEQLKRRNVLEMEGYNNEASMLRLRLSHVEKVYSARQRQGMRRPSRATDSP